MSYNKTLLYSGSSTVLSCTLSESAANFRRLEIWTGNTNAGGFAVQIPSFTNKTNQLIMTPGGNWSTDVYMIKVGRLSIGSNGTSVSIDGFNIIGLYDTAKTPYHWGNGVNNTNNRKQILKIYGVDRINYTEQPGLGSPGTGWRKYNETLLWSGSNTSTINVSEAASNFERLRLKLGTSSTAQTYMEVDAPLDDGYILTTQSYVTNSASSYRFAWSYWTWSNGCKTLTAVNGKSFQNTDTNHGSNTGTLDNSDTDINKRPILEIVGINRK